MIPNWNKNNPKRRSGGGGTTLRDSGCVITPMLLVNVFTNRFKIIVEPAYIPNPLRTFQKKTFAEKSEKNNFGCTNHSDKNLRHLRHSVSGTTRPGHIETPLMRMDDLKV
jgi:hypothetical protein